MLRAEQAEFCLFDFVCTPNCDILNTLVTNDAGNRHIARLRRLGAAKIFENNY